MVKKQKKKFYLYEKMSQLDQDKNVLEFYSQKKNGFFLEIGAYDGIEMSNTLLLEKVGWTGICVEPLPKMYEKLVNNRKCKTYQLAIDIESGKSLSFVEAEMLSGDITRIDKDRIVKTFGSQKLENTITVKTINLTDLLIDAGAPTFIDFLSLDTEGSELDILRGHDFSLYKFGYISVEHNYKQPARKQIREFLESKGYTFFQENEWDDDYVLEYKKFFLAKCIICHDDESVILARKNYPNAKILFVGGRELSDKTNVIIMRDLPKNIEHFPQFLTFCAWWAVVHNNLFRNYEYIALLEWDTRPHKIDFWQQVEATFKDSSIDAIGLLPYTTDGFWSERDLSQNFENIMKTLNLSYPKSNKWYATSNAIMKREKLNEFVFLFETVIDLVKNDPKCKWIHERVYFLWMETHNVVTIHGLTHFQGESHGLYETSKRRHNYIYIGLILLFAVAITYAYYCK